MGSSKTENLLPPEADPYFRAERITVKESCLVDEGYSVLIVTRGRGEIHSKGNNPLPVKSGTTALIPWVVGPIKITGNIEIIRCYPPKP